MGTMLKDLRTLFSTRGGEIERKAAEFKAQREKRAADFAAKAEPEKEAPGALGAIPELIVDAAGEIAEKLGLGTKAGTRELADRIGRHIGRLFT
ncbi:MAG: hypothetical protein JXD23_00765 [Spirochaetales bacterium]|nr:hypothetical protein [Spirochaetales bacterium]